MTNERLYAAIDNAEAEYHIAAEMKTKFNLQGVSTKEAHDEPADGDGPFVVVLKHSVAGKCLLIIYDKDSANHTIEELNVCRGGERASMAITLPIRVESSSRSPKNTSSLNSQAICLNLFPSSASQPIPSPTKKSLDVNILRTHNFLLNLRVAKRFAEIA
ncbi:unnamed protein product [Taenia asiatica]|uniref:ADF-H domain-containing protein n=1 Tax=Taenia asiatica TaxID=60517 RepID=A0A0R3WFR0_TAEAS|nr:unnamed protein product [Taenia asiatica]